MTQLSSPRSEEPQDGRPPGPAAGAASSSLHVLGPCLQIQADLSAMLDGELDASSVRRVMVHSDVCESCRSFLQGIRTQAQAHRSLGGVLHGKDDSPRTRQLREQLIDNRKQLARILYELGRGFVLMYTSPGFSRIVAKEPVPIPDMCRRGRNLLDEVQRLHTGRSVRDGDQVKFGEDWVVAADLFEGGKLNDPKSNLEKGKRLLRDALGLRPDYHEARIYLGHAHHVGGERTQACAEFRAVLDGSTDVVIRAYALENLGNVHLESGDLEGAIPCFQGLVESGAVQLQARFFTSYFNLALAYGLLERFDQCEHWLDRLHGEFPHKRRMIGQELASRTHLAAVLTRHPDVQGRFSERYPGWFPRQESQV